jgi:hypothetical protein
MNLWPPHLHLYWEFERPLYLAAFGLYRRVAADAGVELNPDAGVALRWFRIGLWPGGWVSVTHL